ncbi:hypothetical protein PGT21_029698 [Puccinia graminis f. sp. tritici]|uniref:Uncharacterized protein n=1 Tax=Puccinia graminis f. sp. tritici TaxID=56615 RepID=A0A5B0N7N2_PUCGR|nr:hypothetical protein PGT21_029698 [Puccinia graminis f. sp. tritici]
MLIVSVFFLEFLTSILFFTIAHRYFSLDYSTPSFLTKSVHRPQCTCILDDEIKEASKKNYLICKHRNAPSSLAGSTRKIQDDEAYQQQCNKYNTYIVSAYTLYCTLF